MRARALLAVFALLAVLPAIGGTAWAQSGPTGMAGAASCPQQPLAYEGEDEVRAEVRALRRDVIDTCRAAADRLEALGAITETGADDVSGSVEALPGRSAGRDDDNPAFVQMAGATGATGPQDAELVVAAVEQSRDTARDGLSVLVGLVLLGLLVPAFRIFWGYRAS